MSQWVTDLFEKFAELSLPLIALFAVLIAGGVVATNCICYHRQKRNIGITVFPFPF